MAKLTDFIDPDVIAEYLETSEDILAGKMALAQEVVDYAQSIAPVDSGDYKAGIRVRRYGKSGVGIEFSDDASSFVEYGTEDTPEFAVMRKSIEHFQNR
ncbi:MAG: HK97 gp10 family phage protein [Candidatus Nanopelagicales bacterium]|jgi:hypothetical protein|nr:HK97 gp10 family phage protein [Candidatus Nanopelagicales bacterium]